MGERDRYQSYEDRNEGRFQDRDEYSRDRDDPFRAQSRERNWSYRNDRDYGRDYERTYGSQNPERTYGQSSGGYESRRFPGTFGSYEDQRYGREWNRDRNFDAERHYGGSQEDRNRGQEWQRYPSRERFDYSRSYGGYEGDYRERGGRDEGFGQHLREAGQRLLGKVKRVFRAPKGYKRSDERIREDVNDQLAQNEHLDPSDIEVAVSGAEVTLTGRVDTRREKFLAEEIADDVGGVTDVHNQLRVGRSQAQTESTASSATQSATEAARSRNARAQ